MRAWLLSLGVAIVTSAAGASDSVRSREWEERMLDAVNAERAERGLPRYRLDRDLVEAAADHARRMAQTGRLAHQLPGEPDLRTRVAATGLRFDAAGENVGYSTRVEELHDNLMRSRGHRQNILATRYDSIGIGIYESGGRFWVTQTFARATSQASSLDAVDQFAAAIAEIRRSRRLPAMKVDASNALRDAACTLAREDRVEAALVPRQPGARHVVVFTTFEPGDLQGTARKVAAEPDVERLAVGVCHRSTRTYPAGVFWFALAY
jgi:uncharacterized protein YkwD